MVKILKKKILLLSKKNSLYLLNHPYIYIYIYYSEVKKINLSNSKNIGVYPEKKANVFFCFFV